MAGTPISDRALDLALERRLITPDQVAALRAIEREEEPPEPRDEEALRFVTGFADIFVSIGIVLFVGALAFIMDAGAGSTPMFAGVAACAWLLAEFFTGKRRMALPSIVLLVIFVAAVFVITLQVATSMLPQPRLLPERLWFLPTNNPAALAVAAIFTVAMAAMHYVRFRVPITIAAGAAGLCVLALGLAAIAVPDIGETAANGVLFVCGLAVFALAMRFDMADPERLTRRTDIAFWLHLLAAPLIVHPLIKGFLHGLDGRLTLGAALGILWVFLILGVVAVIIDRRAILVSGLVYAGFAFGTVIETLGLAGSHLLLPTVLLALGAFILLVSAGWQPLRRALLRRLPQGLARRLPHPLVASST
jgi:hypothetical protein